MPEVRDSYDDEEDEVTVVPGADEGAPKWESPSGGALPGGNGRVETVYNGDGGATMPTMQMQRPIHSPSIMPRGTTVPSSLRPVGPPYEGIE